MAEAICNDAQIHYANAFKGDDGTIWIVDWTFRQFPALSVNGPLSSLQMSGSNCW